ncbi:MAG: HAD family hydrolase [Actinobacteria bacterium]|nr:MAG: HAD family hydrolase [Actinomycetota bacterium]
MNEAWHKLEADELFEALGTGVDGLAEDEARRRLSSHGRNRLAEERRTSPLQILARQVASPLIYILLAATFVTLLLRDFVDAAVISAAVVLNTVIGYMQEHKAEESLKALGRLLVPKATVMRGGHEHEIDSEELVPGDVVLLRAGGRVPADLRLVSEREFRVDESAFTGESEAVSKTAEPIERDDLQLHEQKNLVFMGTVVTAGRAGGAVVATGQHTQLGQISKEISEMGLEKTPLQRRVERLSRYILLAVIGFGLTGLAVGITRGEDIILLLLAVIGMAVATVPEGLPVVLTIALAVGVNRVAGKRALIRRLPAIETMGSSTVIGSDKTGTLTRNEMTVQAVWSGGRRFEVEGRGYEPAGDVVGEAGPMSPGRDELLDWTLRVGLLATESELVEEEGRWRAKGDPTEVALIVSAMRGGTDEQVERERFPLLDLLPFESERRYMATLHSHDASVYLFVKGAPERLLDLSSDIAGDGNDSLTPDRVLAEENRLAERGLRVLAMAYRRMPEDKREITHEDVAGLTFLGLQGMMDPPRPEAIEAVASAKRSGIRVLMITGDNERTALSIAKAMGIAGEHDDVIGGGRLDGMSDSELGEVVASVSVFARTSPQHKLRIVNSLKAHGEVVAVTGDGVNDAAALKAADIGVAMGISGTDVAKEASDMVVTDDNFASIYEAIIEGRAAFDNIRKVTFFLLPTGLGTLIAIFVTIVGEAPLILLPAQILWANLVTNGLQDVALAFDPKEPGIEGRPPRDPREGILSRLLWIRLVVVGAVVAAAALGTFLWLLPNASLEHARTVALTAIVFTQFFHVFNSRSETKSVFRQNPLENRFLFFSMLAAFVAQMSILYVPAMNTLFRTTPLGARELLPVLAISSLILVASEIDKARLRRRMGRV